MGKKTTQFMTSLKGQMSALQEPLVNVITVSGDLKSQMEEHAKLMDKMQEVTDKYMPSNSKGDNRGNQKLNPEKQLAADPEFKKVEAQMGALNKRMEFTSEWKSELKSDLKKGQKELDGTIKNFDAFVQKKKDAWMGSKKSVPDSEKLIKEGKTLSKAISDVVRTI